MHSSIFIYGLYPPGASLPMYVGKGVSKYRPSAHWKNFLATGKATNAVLRVWFERLQSQGCQPEERIIDVAIFDDWESWEKFYIAYFRQLNPLLCNVADGGNSGPVGTANIGGLIAHRAHPDLAIRAGRIGGSRNVQRHPEFARDGARKAHAKHPEMASKVARRVHAMYPNLHSRVAREVNVKYPGLGGHYRWHLSRGVVKLGCIYCQRGQLAAPSA